MNKRLLKIFYYCFLFIFFFLCLQYFYFSVSADSLINYGFSYAIRIGEVPYRDFNMIITPFSAFFYTIPLLFFNNYLFFNLFQALLLCLFFRLLYKLIGAKSFIVLAICFLLFPGPFPTVLYANYNFILLFLTLILIYLEKNNGNDYLIGFILGLCFLTKQTVGGTLILVSLFYIKNNFQKAKKRFIGLCFPLIIFVLYLLFSDSFKEFFDLCFLGMFDFTSNNTKINSFYSLLFVILELIIFYRIFSNKNNIYNYYLLAFSIIQIPLFDFYHFSIFLILFLVVLLNELDINYSENLLFFLSFIAVFSFFTFWIFKTSYYKINLLSFNHFSSNNVHAISYEDTLKNVNNIIKTNEDKKIIIFSNSAYFYKISNNLNINYYDLLNYGNHGYNGTLKLKNMIKSEKNPLFIINLDSYNDKSKYSQFNKDIVDYVLTNYDCVYKFNNYVIYN